MEVKRYIMSLEFVVEIPDHTPDPNPVSAIEAATDRMMEAIDRIDKNGEQFYGCTVTTDGMTHIRLVEE